MMLPRLVELLVATQQYEDMCRALFADEYVPRPIAFAANACTRLRCGA
jgi:hypothetical protein